MANGQRAGFTFISGHTFGWVGVRMAGGVRRIQWDEGQGPVVPGNEVWLRGRYEGDRARLEYSFDGVTYTDIGVAVPLRFGHWKGARIGIFCYGDQGHVDVDYVRYVYGDAAPTPGER
jgi:beta-xylosidase-like protein